MAIKKSMSAAVAIEKLEAQCSMSEYCSSEVMDKLYRWGVPSADRAGILAHLVEARFVDDSRYARGYVRDKAPQYPFGADVEAHSARCGRRGYGRD